MTVFLLNNFNLCYIANLRVVNQKNPLAKSRGFLSGIDCYCWAEATPVPTPAGTMVFVVVTICATTVFLAAK